MEACLIDGGQRQAAGPEDFAQRLAAHPAIGDELAELSALLQARSNLNPQPVPGMEDTPLCLHAAYGARGAHGGGLADGHAPRTVARFQLFVRPRNAERYRAFGPVVLASAQGDRPMSIVWRLGTA